MEFLIIFLAILITIAMHEVGHYIFGIIVGIPSKKMKIRLLTFPQHVAIKKDNKWISPQDKNYVSEVLKYIKTEKDAFLYVSGGFILETIFFIFFVLISKHLGLNENVLQSIIITLILFHLLYFLMDLIITAKTQNPSGDLTGLWKISKLGTLIIIGLMIIVYLIALWYVLS